MLTEDDTGDLTLVFFRANQGWVEKALPLGATRWVSGLVEIFDFYKQMVHPDRILDEAGLAALPPVEPVYGLTEGLFQRVVAKAAAAALDRLPGLPEWLEDKTLRAGWEFLARASQNSTIRSSRRILRPRANSGRGSPMTSFCRTSLPCVSCAPKCRRCAGARKPATGG